MGSALTTNTAVWQVRLLQGRKHTWVCGSYTLFNTQEIAVMSGLAVAERLGADYPFPDDSLAAKQFDMYLGIAHGAKRRKPPVTKKA
jgi:predicted NAD/FAD-binding protein